MHPSPPQSTEVPQTKLEKYTNTKQSIGNTSLELHFFGESIQLTLVLQLRIWSWRVFAVGFSITNSILELAWAFGGGLYLGTALK